MFPELSANVVEDHAFVRVRMTKPVCVHVGNLFGQTEMGIENGFESMSVFFWGGGGGVFDH